MPKETIFPEMLRLAKLIHEKNHKEKAFDKERVIRITHEGIGEERLVILIFSPDSPSILEIIRENFEEMKDLSFYADEFKKISFIHNGIVFAKMDDFEAINITYALIALGVAHKFSPHENKRQPDPKDKVA